VSLLVGAVASSPPLKGQPTMKLCPIAIAVTCRKCPVVSVCPVKTVIGDYVKPEPGKPAAKPKKR
jgi:hypothetical protein